MLDFRAVCTTGWTRATAVRCPGGHPAEEPVTAAAVVLVRRGVFVRHAGGRAVLADVTTGYLQRPGETQRISHPRGGDVCTSLTVPPELADRFAAAGPVRVPPAADLIHRRLLAAPAGERPDLVGELLAALLPATAVTRSAHPVVEGVRELLHTDPALGLTALAASAGWSPWHLSRSFRQVTGSTLSAYRGRLRVRAAIDDLTADPGAGLAAIAARAGFADQAHMTRAIRAETGESPAALRRRLSGDDQAAARTSRGAVPLAYAPRGEVVAQRSSRLGTEQEDAGSNPVGFASDTVPGPGRPASQPVPARGRPTPQPVSGPGRPKERA
jgi:AraC-like DNA-binding protein